MDLELDPLFNFRGGIILNPIGAFKQNHDGLRWDFIYRPISATLIIPSTLSNVGMEFHSKYFSHNLILGYEFDLTNGFDNKVIDNNEGRISLHFRIRHTRFFKNSDISTTRTHWMTAN